MQGDCQSFWNGCEVMCKDGTYVCLWNKNQPQQIVGNHVGKKSPRILFVLLLAQHIKHWDMTTR